MNTAKVYYLKDYSEVAKSSSDESNIYTAEVTNKRERPSSIEGIATSSLYGNVYNDVSFIPRVLALLGEGKELLISSSKYLSQGDEVSSDNDIQHFLALLPELFCCRSIGDGFASIITSIYNSVINQSEIGLLSGNQIAKVLLLIEKIQNEPFLELDEAIDLILLLDDAGLNVEPKHLNRITEILCGK